MILVDYLRDFFAAGGSVLVLIFCVTALLWVLLFDRIMYLSRGHKAELQAVMDDWCSLQWHSHWHSDHYRLAAVSIANQALQRNLLLIKTLITICPLMGLLGTVNGMVHVFDVLSVTGTSNPRAMAEGISRATIPTMAGMVAALTGLLMLHWVQTRAARLSQQFKYQLDQRGATT
ncbi:MAG: MotA/TolQ/ExbB proton channel family protein [Halieaceae bacterium]|jgi:biopolymer transport protein ExbB|nr:MotA/TolQ/ExbB proton channel family protein [Halieaceae bacterium]